LNRRIAELCARKGFTFQPWKCPPDQSPDELPADYVHNEAAAGWYASLPQAVRLRRRLIAEIEADE
jgi:hypothetical protein